MQQLVKEGTTRAVVPTAQNPMAAVTLRVPAQVNAHLPRANSCPAAQAPDIQDRETLVGVIDGRGADGIKTGKGKRAGSILDQSV